MPYGTYGGMPNYRHAEPFCQLKNLKDLVNEDHHFPTKYFKLFLAGAFTGIVYGSAWTFIRPMQGFAVQKLMAHVGDREWTGRIAR